MSLKTAFASLPATIFIRRCISRPLAARWRTRFDVAPCPSYDEVGNARVLGFSRKQLTYHLSVAVSRGVRDAVQHGIELTFLLERTPMIERQDVQRFVEAWFIRISMCHAVSLSLRQ
jgi:hypothetical protein